MSTPTPPPTTVAPRRRTSVLKMMFWLLVVPIALIVGYFAVVLNWNYSTGERAGWVQKLSRKGWLCKTWEGEMAMVSMPGAIPEKFLFTVRDDAVAENINKVMGKRVTLHYEEKVGLPTSCFGETRHFVTSVLQVEDIPLVPGVVVPNRPAAPSGAPAAPSPSTQPAPSSPLPSPTPPPSAPDTSPAKN
jgi:hypothetical protein